MQRSGAFDFGFHDKVLQHENANARVYYGRHAVIEALNNAVTQVRSNGDWRENLSADCAMLGIMSWCTDLCEFPRSSARALGRRDSHAAPTALGPAAGT